MATVTKKGMGWGLLRPVRCARPCARKPRLRLRRVTGVPAAHPSQASPPDDGMAPCTRACLSCTVLNALQNVVTRCCYCGVTFSLWGLRPHGGQANRAPVPQHWTAAP